MELVLGTANLGLPYGKALARSLPTENQVRDILNQACALGIKQLDTAAAYGESERRIGCFFATADEEPFSISTKTHPSLGEDAAEDTLGKTMARSREALLPGRIDQLLLHRWGHRTVLGGRIWTQLLERKAAKEFERLGVSVQSPLEAMQAASTPGIDVIQLACNILDWRYDTPDVRAALEAFGGRIEVRSVFLQGLLTLSPGVRFPDTPDLYEPSSIVHFLSETAERISAGDLVALCLRYARSLEWADALVVGVDDPKQLEVLTCIMRQEPLTPNTLSRIREERPNVPVSLLDPAQWI